MATRAHPGTAQIELRLRKLEGLRAAVGLARGVALWVCLVLPAAAALCALDWYSHMPLAVRWVAAAGLLALMWFAARRFIAPALRSRRVIDQTALAVEGRFPELADRIISAVQLERHPGDWAYGSPELVAATQQQAAEFASRTPFHKAQPLGGPAALLAAGMLVLAASAWATASFPAIVSTWAARCVWNFDYPSRTQIVDCPRSIVAPRGEGVDVTIKAAGILPERGVLEIRTTAAGRVKLDLVRSQDRTRRHEYSAHIDQVVEPLAFRALIGDAEAFGRIEVADRPEIADIRAELTYPSYTGLRGETLQSGHLRALAGTHVRLDVRASKPLAQAAVLFDDGRKKALSRPPSAGSAAQPPSDHPTGELWSTDFDIAKNGGYSVHMIDQINFANATPVHYQIVAAPDNPPRVQLIKPGAEVLATPVSIVRLTYRLSDDYGLRRGQLLFRLNDEKEFRAIPLPLPGLASTQPDAQVPAPGPREAAQTLAWDLSLLGLKVGDVITYRLSAEDHAPRATPLPGISPDREIRIADQLAVQKQLQDELDATAQQIERLFTLERESQDRIEQLRTQIKTNGAATKPANH